MAINSVGLRPLTVYGVGRDTGMTSDPTKAMKAAVVGRPFHIRFGGKTDFLYVADCADAFIRAASADLEGAHVFNSHGETVEVAAVVEEIEKLIPEAEGLITFDPDAAGVAARAGRFGDRPRARRHPAYSTAQGMQERRSTRFTFLRSAGRLDTNDLDQ